MKAITTKDLIDVWQQTNAIHLDENLFLSWYMRIKGQQAQRRCCKVWDIKRGDHKL